MVYIKVNSDKKIIFEHYKPHILGSEEELKKEGYILESMPSPENIQGKFAQGFYDNLNNMIYFEYYNLPVTESVNQQNLIDQLIIDNLNMQMQIDTLKTSSSGGM